LFFEVKDKELAGRIGKLKTKSGIIETPAFFPVVNPFKQHYDVPISKIREIGFTQVITNSYIIKNRLGDEAKRLGVHKVVGFDLIVMTDSGAYQILEYGRDKVPIDPIEIVKYQEDINSDIAVIADIPTRDDASYTEALESVKETLRRAKLVSPLIEDSSTLWVLPIQGGVYTELVKISAEGASRIPNYSMYAIGSPVTVLEKYDFKKIVDMVAVAKKILPPDKPVHLFGGGHPLIIPLMVALGIDSFDSASYILYARQGRYMTEHGTYRLADLDYFPCECEVCSRHTPKEIMELDKRKKAALIALHNLYTINKEIKRTKLAIREGRLWELLEERARTHPSIREALTALIKYIDWIEKLDPRIKGDVHGMFLYDETSYYRPELIRHRKSLNQYIEKTSRKQVILIPGDFKDKPFRYSEIYKEVKEKIGLVEGTHKVFIYLPFFDVIPLDIDQMYPYSQFEAPDTPSTGVINSFRKNLRSFIKAISERADKIVIVTCSDFTWSKPSLIKSITKGLDNKLTYLELCK
jgi:7-cyano-7-deazaguanine tRNA-ribosyltransferase